MSHASCAPFRDEEVRGLIKKAPQRKKRQEWTEEETNNTQGDENYCINTSAEKKKTACAVMQYQQGSCACLA